MGGLQRLEDLALEPGAGLLAGQAPQRDAAHADALGDLVGAGVVVGVHPAARPPRIARSRTEKTSELRHDAHGRAGTRAECRKLRLTVLPRLQAFNRFQDRAPTPGCASRARAAPEAGGASEGSTPMISSAPVRPERPPGVRGCVAPPAGSPAGVRRLGGGCSGAAEPWGRGPARPRPGARRWRGRSGSSAGTPRPRARSGRLRARRAGAARAAGARRAEDGLAGRVAVAVAGGLEPAVVEAAPEPQLAQHLRRDPHARAASRGGGQPRSPTAAGPARTACPAGPRPRSGPGRRPPRQLWMPGRSWRTACSRQPTMSSSWMNWQARVEAQDHRHDRQGEQPAVRRAQRRARAVGEPQDGDGLVRVRAAKSATERSASTMSRSIGVRAGAGGPCPR